jgi:phosphohistidine swiveling domain-containing protein
MTAAPQFDAPGPGFWDRDAVHFPRPATRYWAEVHPEPFERGVREFASGYGMLFDGLQMAYVAGVAYKQILPVADEEVPARFGRAQATFEERLWRKQLSDWDTEIKPASIKAHLDLQSVDADALPDGDLADYLGRCRAHHSQMIYQHMRHTAAALVPTGDFLAHVGDWTGLGQAELLGLMRGSSPVSAGASEQLTALIEAIRQDSRAQQLLDSDGDPGGVLDELRSLDRPTGPAVQGYLDLVGYRLLDGFDISNPYALELPDALVRAIRAAVADTGAGSSDVEERIADVRGKVPGEHRAEFDQLLDEARLTYRIRDERGVFSDIWASGLMRRAALAAGRRLAAAGRLHEPIHMIDAELAEMQALVTGTGGPSADELAARLEQRESLDMDTVPPAFGDPPPPPPDPSGLPPAAGRLMRATGIAMQEVFGSSEAAHEGDLLRGLAASPGVYEGPARRISGPAEFDRITKGDVLVTVSTSEAFNILLPLLGAIVTDAGGLLSHSAIVAREYGIPGVVGTREATMRIADGARVRVDGTAGEVAVLA